MIPTNPISPKNRQEWREWLEAHHAAAGEAWLAYAKKGSGLESVSYDEAVEEALCFGWIDGLTMPGDERVYYQRFTPRTSRSQWSEINKRRAARMLQQGRMTPAGLERVDFDLAAVDPDAPLPQPKELPEHIAKVLKEHPPAWDNLQAMAPSNRAIYFNFLTSAKKPETLAKRLERAVELLKQNKRLQDG
jgi:uncharacterized protein YdeI (YjbR/CyaY-like superfamily)